MKKAIIFLSAYLLFISPLFPVTDNFLLSNGIGVPPQGQFGSKAKLLARDAAIADAGRNLIEMIQGLRLSSLSSFDSGIGKTIITTQSSGFIQHQKILSEKQNSDGSVEVVVGIPITDLGISSDEIGDIDLSALYQSDMTVTGKSGIQWDSGLIVAEGNGFSSEDYPAKCRVTARRAAILDAQKNLLAQLQSVTVQSNTSVTDMETTNDTIKTKLTGLVKGFQILKETYESTEKHYTVLIGVKLFGKNSAAAIVAPKVTAPVFPVIKSKSKPADTITNTDTTTNANTPQYSGLIIEAKGIDFPKSLFPIVRSVSGTVIYSLQTIMSKYAGETGMVQYADKLERALKSKRAGNHPLIIQMKDSQYGDLLISDIDARDILEANQITHFLEQLNVVVVTE